MHYRAVLSEVESWPMDDPARLIDDLWDRMPDSNPDSEPSEEIKAELDCRIEEMDRNPEAGVPWESVKARLLARFQG